MTKEEPWYGDHHVMWGYAALTGGKTETYIGRDDGDFFFARREDDTGKFWVGDWLTGFGFINVKFPKATSRELSWAEKAWLAKHPVGIA